MSERERKRNHWHKWKLLYLNGGIFLYGNDIDHCIHEYMYIYLYWQCDSQWFKSCFRSLLWLFVILHLFYWRKSALQSWTESTEEKRVNHIWTKWWLSNVESCRLTSKQLCLKLDRRMAQKQFLKNVYFSFMRTQHFFHFFLCSHVPKRQSRKFCGFSWKMLNFY